MKILHVITSLKIGGAEKLLTDIIPLLQERNHQIDLLLFDGIDTIFKEKLEKKGVTLFSLGVNHSVYNPIYIYRLCSYLSEYDIIHTHNTVCQYYLVFAKLLSFSRTKLVTTEHSTINRRRNKYFFRLIDRFIYCCYDKIIGISDKTTEGIVEHTGMLKNIITIPNGIDIAQYKFSYITPRESIFPIAPNDRLLIQVARFDDAKDQDTVIRSLALLPSFIHLVLVGDGERKKKCEMLAKILNVSDRVYFMGIRSDVPQLLKMADIVVMSSHWEGFGLAAVEGMAAVKPVVASDVPGLAEVVKNAGLLFEVQNERDLANSITQLIDDDAYYQFISERCYKRALEYDINKMVKSYETLYLQLCNNTDNL